MNGPLTEPSTKTTLQQLMDFLNKGISEAEPFCLLSISSGLQWEKCLALDLLLHNATINKQRAVQQGAEDVANLLLGFECSIGAIRSELMMWILLKRDQPDKAWERLVAAQIGCIDATRAHQGFAHCGSRLQDLNQIESLIFPQQVFVSAGFIADKLDCSICGDGYSKCDHLRGKPYMGEFCEVVHRNMRGDHLAIVDTPADRRCRVVSIKTKDGHENKLSWAITPFGEDEQFDESEPLEATTVMLTGDRYPYLASTEEILGPRA